MWALTEFLFPAPAQPGTASIFRWWEARRLRYNLIVGTTGLFTLGAAQVMAVLPPPAVGLPPLLPAILLYGTLANVCYCAGPLAELLAGRLWQGRLLPVGPTLFRMGLTFSVGLTLFPALLMGLDWVRRLLFWVLF